MNLEIHKNPKGPDVLINVSETFGKHHSKENQEEILRGEAEVLYQTLKESLPSSTKKYLLDLLKHQDENTF